MLLAMGVWLIFGLFSAIPDGYWAPTLGCVFLIPYFWYTDNSKVLPYMLGALFVSLYIGFALSSTFQPLDEADAWGMERCAHGLHRDHHGHHAQLRRLVQNASLHRR